MNTISGTELINDCCYFDSDGSWINKDETYTIDKSTSPYTIKLFTPNTPTNE